MSNDRPTAWALSLFVVFLWSTSIVMIRTERGDIPPITYAAYRYLIASLLLVSIWCIRRRRIMIEKTHLKDIIILGMLGYALSQGLLYIGIYHLTTATVTILLNLMPILAIAFSIRSRDELPSRFQFISILFGIFGVVVFFWNDMPSYGNTLGILAMVLSSATWALYSIRMRKAASTIRKIDYLEYTAFPMLIGSILMLAYSGARGDIVSIRQEYIGSILWLSVVNTSLAFLLWNLAHKHLKAFEISMAHNTMVFQASILAFVLIGESLSLTNVAGIVIVFASLTLLETGERLRTRLKCPLKCILKHV